MNFSLILFRFLLNLGIHPTTYRRWGTSSLKFVKARYSLSPSYMCFAINGDKASLAAKINDVLDEMRLNGELNKLNNMWQIAGMNDHVAKPIDVNNLKKAIAKLHIR